MPNLTADPWILSNSPIQAERLHAMGVIAFRWNQCEFWLFLLFCRVIKLPRRDAWVLVHDLGDIAICSRIQVLATRQDFDDDGIALIKNALAVYDICRQNRNAIVHAWTLSAHTPDVPLARKSKNADRPEPDPFPSKLGDLRRVADEIEAISNRLWILNCLLEEGSLVKPLSSPGKLPLPEILWKPPQKDQSKRRHQP